MKAAVLIYWPGGMGASVHLAWVDPFAHRVLHVTPTPVSPNIGVFAGQDCALVSYTEYPEGSCRQYLLDVYRLSDWSLRARLPLDYRAHFNFAPVWPPFLLSPDHQSIYLYKAKSLGNH